MDISITEFKQRCLELIRRVEATGKPVSITCRGNVVAQLEPRPAVALTRLRPWERLRRRVQWLADGRAFHLREGHPGPLIAVLLDTHIWVWWLSGFDRLSERESSASTTSPPKASFA